MMTYNYLPMSSLLAVDTGERSTPDELSFYWDDGEEVAACSAGEAVISWQARVAA